MRTAIAIIAALNIPLSMWYFYHAFSLYLARTKHPENWPADTRATVTPEPTDATN